MQQSLGFENRATVLQIHVVVKWENSGLHIASPVPLSPGLNAFTDTVSLGCSACTQSIELWMHTGGLLSKKEA